MTTKAASLAWRYRLTPRRLPDRTTPRGRWALAAVAIVLALFTGMANAHASTLPCVQDPALIVIVVLATMAGIVIGAITALVTSR